MIKRWPIDWYNRQRSKVFIEGDHFIGIDGKRRFSVPIVEIEAILDVAYENPGAFDIDEFCVLLLKDRFFLTGLCTAPCIIINAIKALRPKLSVTCVWFEYIPWRLRDRGFFGLRVFDMPGMGIFPLRYLPKYTLREDPTIAIEATIQKDVNNAQK